MSRSDDSHTRRRTGIILNYLCLILMALSIMALEYRWGVALPAVGLGLGVVVFIVTFIPLYARTGLWKFVHLPFRNLDEREAQIILYSLRISYTIFSVLALLYIFLLTIGIQVVAGWTDPTGDFTFGNVLFAAFIYLSHILPASIIAWSERKVM